MSEETSTIRLKAVSLRRRSTNDQPNSLERQEEGFATYCERHNLQPVGDYVDDAVSATRTRLLDRPAIRALLRDAERGKFTVVWYEEYQRAARRGEELVDLDARLREHGCFLVGYDEDPRTIGDAYFRKVMLFLGGWRGEGETKDLARRTKDTLRMRVSQGYYRGGAISLGLAWKWDDPPKTKPVRRGHWEIDEEKATLAERIFRLYVERRNLEEIAELLNDEGIPTGKGNLWSGSSVRALLRAPNYRGYLRFGGEDFPCHLPQVVPQDLVDKVDAIFANKLKRGPRSDASEYATFQRLLRCPECGGWLGVHPVRRVGNYLHISYYCHHARLQPATCSQKRYMGQRRFEEAMLQLVADRLEEYLAVLPEGARHRGQSPQVMQRRARRLETEHARVLVQHQKGWITDEQAAGRMQEIADRKAALGREQKALEEPEAHFTRGDLEKLIKRLRRGDDWFTWSVKRRRDILQALIEYIVPNREDFSKSLIIWNTDTLDTRPPG